MNAHCYAPIVSIDLSYARDPAWLPYIYDADRDDMIFVYAPRETQRRATFLDPRFLHKAPRTQPLPMAELTDTAIEQPVHYILHTAFCCSTLLTRALDIPGAAMGLKEPSVLPYFARAWRRGLRDARLSSLTRTLDLLARPLEPGETQIVKPSNLANPLGADLLALRPNSKALILHGTLESFLAATARARGADGRDFGRDMHDRFAPEGAAAPEGDGEAAADAWMLQAAVLQTVLQRFGAERVRTLSADALLADPSTALARLGDFLGISANWPAIAAGPVFHEHAKRIDGRVFDAKARSAQLAKSLDSARDEIESGLAWAAQTHAPIIFGDTLLG